ncbi:MAG: sigma factor [Phycisphaerae bacterium]
MDTLKVEQLLDRFISGKADALGELARRYERLLLGLAVGLLGGRRDAACDAVQDTWLRVIRFGRRFDRRGSFKTWIYRITLNCARSTRAARVGRSASLTDAVLSTGDDASGTFHDTRLHESAAGRASPKAPDRSAELRDAVERLPETQRNAVPTRYRYAGGHACESDLLVLNGKPGCSARPWWRATRP